MTTKQYQVFSIKKLGGTVYQIDFEDGRTAKGLIETVKKNIK